MSYALSLAEHYAEVRNRLHHPKPKLSLVAAPIPDPAPEPAPIVNDVENKAPLNMLAPCSWRFLLALAAVQGDVGQRDILGLNRAKKVMAARHYAMAAIYQHTQHSLPAVGKLLNRDHSTVLHATKKLGRTEKLVDLLPTTLGSIGSKLLSKASDIDADPQSSQVALFINKTPCISGQTDVRDGTY